MLMSKRAQERATAGLKRLIPIIQQQKARDVSEADTVTLVKDILSEICGYDKYSELTGEFAIRGTYCDLAIKLDDKLVQLIEVKAIGTDLGEKHIKQGVDYAANKGVEWLILTNGQIWSLYHVVFSKPIDKKLICQLDITAIDHRKEEDMDRLFVFTKDGFKKGAHLDLKDRQEATNRFLMASLLLNNDNVLNALRKELRRIVDVNVSDEEIAKVLRDEVIKRDTLEGVQAEIANKRLRKAEKRQLRMEGKKVVLNHNLQQIVPGKEVAVIAPELVQIE